MPPLRNELHSGYLDYTRVRRFALILMGFCPSCSGPLDTFPQTECRECQIKHKKRYIRGKQQK